MNFSTKKEKKSCKVELIQSWACKECPTYLKAKGKVFATTLSDSDSSNSDSKESCDGEGNYFTFMTIALVDSS